MPNTVGFDHWARSLHVIPTATGLISIIHYFQNKLMRSLPYARCTGHLFLLPRPKWWAQMTLTTGCTLHISPWSRSKVQTQHSSQRTFLWQSGPCNPGDLCGGMPVYRVSFQIRHLQHVIQPTSMCLCHPIPTLRQPRRIRFGMAVQEEKIMLQGVRHSVYYQNL